jgi:hypothetical protein
MADVRRRPPTPRAGDTTSPQTLHTGLRGTWKYQSPRITLLLFTYAEAKGLDPRAVLQKRLQNVERLGPHLTGILERLQRLGYRTERGGPPNLDALRRYQKALGLNPQVAQAIDSVLETFRSKPEDAAASPPLLTFPEKLVVTRATASSKSQLRKTLRHLTKPTPTGDPNAYRRELRFRKAGSTRYA